MGADLPGAEVGIGRPRAGQTGCGHYGELSDAFLGHAEEALGAVRAGRGFQVGGGFDKVCNSCGSGYDFKHYGGPDAPGSVSLVLAECCPSRL